MHNTSPSLDENRILKAPLVKSLGQEKILNNEVGNARSLHRVHHDFESMKLCGYFCVKKKSPSGNSHASDEAIEIHMDSIASYCSATAWSTRYHCTRLLRIA